ncbi:GTPase domain-containing protein [Rhodococcus fascians]|nr:GTPase domain-containing protein [Rhodococcus fascians]
MISRIDIEATKSWLDGLSSGVVGEGLAHRWDQFAATDRPVVTIYGSYDTGKSSLLRRLLIELGEVVPPWLTISARHETFEVSEISAAGCVLRDTPGFVTDGKDARAEMNTALASEAIALTDVAIVALPPQLATAEHSILRELAQQNWAGNSLWFVISRFDEAGVDPDDDPEGYRSLGEHKTVELRKALSLGDEVPVYVISQDFAQMAGADRNPDPSIWNETRDWDGVSSLVAAVKDLANSETQGIRESAAQRFWGNAAQRALEQLSRELQSHVENTAVSDASEQQRASWLAQVDSLTRAYEADLRGRMAAVIGDALDSPDPAKRFAQAAKVSVGAWHASCERDVNKLLRTVSESMVTNRARPDWERFDGMVASLRRKPSSPADSLVFSPVVGQVGAAVLDAMREYEKTRKLKLSPAEKATLAAAAETNRIAAATAGLKIVVEVAKIGEQFVNQQRAAAAAVQQHALLKTELAAAGEQAASVALGSLDAIADDARAQIRNTTADQVDLRVSLHQLVENLRSNIETGTRLLGG